jgi:hypothetical protein
MEGRVEEVRRDRYIRLEEAAHVRQDPKGERVFAYRMRKSLNFCNSSCWFTLVLVSIRSRSGAKKRYREDIPNAGESVLGLGEECDTVAEFAQVGILGPKMSITQVKKRNQCLPCGRKLRIWRYPTSCSYALGVAHIRTESRTSRCCYECSKEFGLKESFSWISKGWHDKSRTFEEFVALVPVDLCVEAYKRARVIFRGGYKTVRFVA